MCLYKKVDKKQLDPTFVLWGNLMPCPFTVPQMFCAGQNFLSRPKNLTAFSASSKNFCAGTILLNANHLFVWHKMFVIAMICN